MTHDEIELELQKYWISKCGGADNYFASPIFLLERQAIDNERKENYNDKRKREFAEADELVDDENEAKKPKKDNQKILDLSNVNFLLMTTHSNSNSICSGGRRQCAYLASVVLSTVVMGKVSLMGSDVRAT